MSSIITPAPGGLVTMKRRLALPLCLPRPILLRLAIGLSLLSSTSGSAQDGLWADQFGWHSVNDQVTCVFPYEGKLLASGDFCLAGGRDARGLAAWDGITWAEFGGGIEGFFFIGVEDMIVFNGDLIVAGDFETIGGDSIAYVARWDGVSWHAMGDGFDWVVEDLEIFNSTLVAGGRFQSSGNTATAHLAYWNGLGWSELGGGTNSEVSCLAIHDGQLVAGGYFTEAGSIPANKIAGWDGSVWSTYGTGFTQGFYDNEAWVQALTVYRGDLYAAGQLGPPLCGVARWNGTTWSSLNNGLHRQGCTGASSLLEFNGDLIVGGLFWSAHNGNSPSSWIDAYGIAKWDGVQWSALGDGLQGDFFQTVRSMCVFNGNLVVGGNFKHAGEVAANCVAVWDGTTWDNFGEGEGLENRVLALHAFGGKLIAGGSFIWAGERAVTERIAQWDGTSWSSFPGGGIHTVYGDIFTITEYQGKLLIAGNIPQIGNLIGSGNGLGLALWDGSAWTTLDGGIDGWIRAVGVYEGKLLAAGEISDYQRGNIQAWDGASWNDLGPGLDEDVYSTIAYKGSLIATGDFRKSGNDSVNFIAAWDGNSWKALGAGLDSPGRALVVFNNRLFVGGIFANAGGIPSRGLAVWNGDGWEDIGNPLDGAVLTFAEINSELYIGGAFRHVDGMIADGLAVYNGSDWRTFGNGVTGSVYAIAPYQNQLYVGGYIQKAGESPSFNFAQLESPVVPTLLLSFRASSTDRGIELHWKFTDESLIASVGVERSDYQNGPWVAPPSLELTVDPDGYQAIDSAVESSRTYFYRLVTVTRAGESKVFGPLQVETLPGTSPIGLVRLSPNPARGGMQITLNVPMTTKVELSILDVHGRLVANLIEGPISKGSHEISWTGDTVQDTASAGIYFVHLRVLGKTFTRRFVLLH